jgi:hypothetical protein
VAAIVGCLDELSDLRHRVVVLVLFEFFVVLLNLRS